MAKKIKLWAFWRYDLYPYVLGAEVAQTNDNGSVCCEGWGGSQIWPRVLVPGKAGEDLLKELQRLRAEYRAAKEKLSNQFCGQARMAFNAFHVSYADFPPLAKEREPNEEQ